MAVQFQTTTHGIQFNYTQIAASFSVEQSFHLRALAAGFGDAYVSGAMSKGSFALGGPAAFWPGLLCAPAGYGSLAVQNGFGCLPILGQCFGFEGYGSTSLKATLNQTTLQGMLPLAKKAEGEDKFAVHQACVSNTVGNPSNLNNSDHITLALHDLLQSSKETRDGTAFKAMKAEDLQKQLKEKYGIDSELTKVKDKSGKELDALKFANGSVFADGAGDGKLDTGDYNFKGRIAEIEKQYGVSADELVKGMKDQKAAIDGMLPGASAQAGFDLSGALQQGLAGTAERVKYDKAVSGFTAELEKKYGVKLDKGVGAQLYEQKQLAERFGVQLDDRQWGAMAQQAAFACDPRVQALLSALRGHGPMGVDYSSIFQLSLGLSMIN